MGKGLNILLLAGSAEARVIAKAALAQGHTVQALVSEAPRGGNPMPVPFEKVTFDNAAALIPRIARFDAVVDASHGFDGAMTCVGHAAAVQAGLPFVSYRRPRWSLKESPLWAAAPDVQGAMTLVHPGARVFSAAGWASLPASAAFPGARLFLRQTSRHARPAPYPFVELVFGDAPFSMDSEVSLFRALQIDTLLCRNLGGTPSRPKLDAALALELRVILIDPPQTPPEAAVMENTDAILDWITQL